MEGIWTRNNSVEDTAAQLINAGIDVLLDPPDPVAMIEGIVKALEAGSIQEAQLDQSIGRLNKLRKGLVDRFDAQLFTHPSPYFQIYSRKKKNT